MTGKAVVVFSGLLLAMLVLQGPALGAETSFSCSVRQGFNFEKDVQDHVGYLTYLKIGGIEIRPELDVTDPETLARGRVVGVLSGTQWGGGYAEPVFLAAQVPVPAKQAMQTMLHKSMSNTEVEFAFIVYSYDYKAHRYYKSFHSDGQVLKGIVMKSGGQLAFAVSDVPSAEVMQPKNFTLSIGIMPQPQSQALALAFSVRDRLVKQWGVAVGR